MIISDLNFCEAVEFANEVFGGATAEADGYADAYAGGAVAYGTAVAEGDTTYADVKTSTIVREKKNKIVSKAKVKAVAWAIDENGRAKDKFRDKDVYVQYKE